MINLQPEEQVQLKARKHWFILFRSFVALLIVWLTPFVLWNLFLVYGGKIEYLPGKETFVNPNPALVSFLSALWTLIIWMKLFAVWTDYYLDIWIVTDRQLISVDQVGLFRRAVSTLHVERIQDATFSIDGIVATLLNFGDIYVQTAAEEKEFIMRGISHPERVKRIILTSARKTLDTNPTDKTSV